MASAPPPLGIIAGTGKLPEEIIRHCEGENRPVFVLAVEGETDAALVASVPHAWVRLGAVGAGIAKLREAGVHDLVLAGKIGRPHLSQLKPDALGAKLIARMGMSFFGGDSAIFKAIVAFFEEEGFRIVGIDAVLSNVVASKGAIGAHLPGPHMMDDIALGIRVAQAIGTFDIGQAVLVKRALVLGVEAAEGTDALIERCASLAQEGEGGVLVKLRKPAQEERVDLPTIGLDTVERMHKAGFAGIAIEAGHSLIAGRSATVARADALGLFLFGFTREP